MKPVQKNISRLWFVLFVFLLSVATSCNQRETSDFDTNPGFDRDATYTEADTDTLPVVIDSVIIDSIP